MSSGRVPFAQCCHPIPTLSYRTLRQLRQVCIVLLAAGEIHGCTYTMLTGRMIGTLSPTQTLMDGMALQHGCDWASCRGEGLGDVGECWFA